MNSQNTADSRSKEWQSLLLLFIRWLVGGLSGIGISALLYFGLKNGSFTGPFLWVLEILSIFLISLTGHIYIYYSGANSFTRVIDFLVTFPILFWGLICALLASGRKEHIKVGVILLVIWVIVGWISFFWVILRYIPT